MTIPNLSDLTCAELDRLPELVAAERVRRASFNNVHALIDDLCSYVDHADDIDTDAMYHRLLKWRESIIEQEKKP